MSEPITPVSSPPPAANPPTPPAPDARDRLHALADTLAKRRDAHLLRQFLLLRAALR